ncbi:hypothetical protein MPL3365_550002 [Mesorhizobium plurifarium]|uniref:Uncharacterized protein n=1 Tax=Mesorhizobium plurifarium TaxID=69974 RepID=A0A090GB61_MESPL|nr:hypothetical protein MPL3365_550002 [Mesorhizobium plurifarium]
MRRLADLPWQGRLSQSDFTHDGFGARIHNARNGSSPRGYLRRFNRKLDARFGSPKAGDRLRGGGEPGARLSDTMPVRGDTIVADDPRGLLRAAASTACSRHR